MRKIKIKLKDVELVTNYLNTLINSEEKLFPANVELILIKNYSYFVEATTIIETFKESLIHKYGLLQQDGTYKLDETNTENYTLYKNELNNFLNKENDISIEEIDINSFDGWDSMGFKNARKLFIFVKF